jgi:hypothetical protein
MRREHPMANPARVEPGITLAFPHAGSRSGLGSPSGRGHCNQWRTRAIGRYTRTCPGVRRIKQPRGEEIRAFRIQPRDDFSRLFQPTHVGVAASGKPVRRWRAGKSITKPGRAATGSARIKARRRSRAPSATTPACPARLPQQGRPRSCRTYPE